MPVSRRSGPVFRMARLIASGDRIDFDCDDPREISGWMRRCFQRSILGSKCWVRTHHTDYFECVSPQIISIAPVHVVNADEKTVIHDVDLFEERGISFELFG